MKKPGIHEVLNEPDGMTVEDLPVTKQSFEIDGEDAGSKIGDGAVGEDQEPGVICQKHQTSPLKQLSILLSY
ncbi:MAG: hypothetical protein JRI22_14860 [Deltaproteobacteria bacterium]|nr:hypothetical protein [Deltaproteobacteria bacterium]